MSLQRPLIIGVGGPVGSGKTTLIKCLITELRDDYSISVITNDIRASLDAEYLIDSALLERERIHSVVTGETKKGVFSFSSRKNANTVNHIIKKKADVDLIFIEGVGDRQDAQFHSTLVDKFVYVCDVNSGVNAPLKGGPGFTTSCLLIVNKTDLVDPNTPQIGVLSLNIQSVRKGKPYLFTSLTTGYAVDIVVSFVRSFCVKNDLH